MVITFPEVIVDPEILQAIVLGIVQGLTEFFPVSSTAHLILFPWVFGWHGEIDTLAFDVALHGGTLVSLLICFYRDWIDMLTKNHKAFLTVMIAAVPAGIAALLLHKIVEESLRNPLIIAVALIVFGFVMLYADRFADRHRADSKTEPSMVDALIIGILQIIALVPGVSRSGITMSTGMFTKLTREGAARFSFLVSTPLIGGATLWEGRKILGHSEVYRLDVVAVGVISAAISGFFAIRFLLSYLKTHRFDAFVYYRFGLAAIILALWLKG
jgi:undecaprenyl-diphosphatase